MTIHNINILFLKKLFQKQWHWCETEVMNHADHGSCVYSSYL